MHHYFAVIGVLAAALGIASVTGQTVAEAEPVEPTPAQLKEAQEAFARLGAEYRAEIDPQTKQTLHVFVMPAATTDADLTKLPRVPFPFALQLRSTQVTDAGLKELKELKRVTTLDLGDTKVTDEGLKELGELKQLTTLNLFDTKVSDAGLKQLKELKQLRQVSLPAKGCTATGKKELEDAIGGLKVSLTGGR